MTLKEIKALLLAASETEEGLLARINELYVQEIRSKDNLVSEALSELHNSGEIDLIGTVKKIDKESCGNGFYSILRTFEDALPFLDVSIEEVLQCLVHLSQQATIGGAYGSFMRFCSLKVNRPRDSIRYILNQSELSAYAPFLSSSILAFDSGNVTEAIQTAESLATHTNATVRKQAYFTLGRIAVTDEQAREVWVLLSDSANSESNVDCRASLLKAVLQFGETFPTYWPQIEKFLITLVDDCPPQVLLSISESIAFKEAALPHHILHLLVKHLARVSPDNKEAIDNIDIILVRLIETGSTSLSIELLESLLSLGVKLTLLDYFSSELLLKHRKLLNHVITKWFVSGKASLCHSVEYLLHKAPAEDFKLNADTALLDSEAKKVFVSEKAVGWLFIKPVAAASFILSIYEAASTTTREALERLLYDPLLLSYPGDLGRFFELDISTDLQKHLCAGLLIKLAKFHADIEKVRDLKELAAPTENVNAYWKALNKNTSEAHELATKSSILNFFPMQKLLYGNCAIYYVHQTDREQVRQETEMHQISHSAEMPRLSILDPERLNYILRVYRYGGMRNEVNT